MARLGLWRRERRVAQHPADATSAVSWIDDDVVQRDRRPAQRHVIESLEASVRVA